MSSSEPIKWWGRKWIARRERRHDTKTLHMVILPHETEELRKNRNEPETPKRKENIKRKINAQLTVFLLSTSLCEFLWMMNKIEKCLVVASFSSFQRFFLPFLMKENNPLEGFDKKTPFKLEKKNLFQERKTTL